METIVIRFFIAFFAIIGYVSTGSAQVPMIDPDKVIITDRSSGEKMSITDWFRNGVPRTTENGCNSLFGFFKFRIRGSGKIDSVRYEGTLEKVMSDKIIDNIRKTQGYWKIPGNTPKNASKWFVFPYFHFGKYYYDDKKNNCSEAEKVLQKNLIYILLN
jgi:hypothetical protein